MRMSYQLNAARTFGEPFRDGLEAHRLTVDLSQRSTEERNRIIRNLARQLERLYHGISAVSHEPTKSVVYLVSKTEPASGTVEVKSKGIVLKLDVLYEGTVRLRQENTFILNDLLREAVRIRARDKGFQQGFAQGKFYGGTPKLFIVGEFQEPVYVYEGFRTKTRVYPEGSALIYLKPTTTWRITLLEYAKTLLARGVSKEVLKNYIIEGRPKRFVTTFPYGRSGLVVDLAFDARPETERIGNESLANYWLRTHSIRLPTEDFVVYVDVEGTTLQYPASQIFLSTRGLNFTREQRALFILPPARERLRILQLLRTLLSEPLTLGDTKVTFNVTDLVGLDQLTREGKIREYGILEIPTLSFGGNGTGKRPLDIRFHGPYSGKRNVNVVYVAPSVASDLVDLLHSQLSQAFGQLKFGTLSNAGSVEIHETPNKIAYRRVATQALVALQNAPDPKVAVILLPIRSEAKYEFIKGASSQRGIAEKRYQFILIGTARRILGGQKEILDSILNQLYFKSSPDEDRALWILSKPAGGVGNTIYAAYDISRETKKEYDLTTKRAISEKTEAASRAALCDCFGLSVRIRSEISPIGEIMTSEVIKDLILDLETDARKALQRFGHDFKRFVLFKDGEVHFNERALALKSVTEVREAIPGLKFELYSVMKRGIERIFQSDSNAPLGFYIIFNDGIALLVSSDLSLQRDKSGLERILANPLAIRMELQAPDNLETPIKQILQEFFDLSRLHWQSPRIKTKACLPLQIVQEMGHYARRGITIPSDMAYIPL